MPRVRRTIVVVFLVCQLLVAGCFSAPIGLAPTTKPLPKGKYTVVGPAVGHAYGFALLGIPLFEQRQAGKARDRAIEDAHADALINVAVDSTMYYFFVFAIYVTTVNGDAVKIDKN
jgi:hypothetical protein